MCEPDEFRQILQWIRMLEDARWGEKMDRDASSGKLDFLFQEAESDYAEDRVREWPPAK